MPRRKRSSGRPSRREWSLDEEITFLQLWQEYITDMRYSKKHAKIHERIANEMNALNFQVTLKDISNKVHLFRKKYRNELKKYGSQGVFTSHWEHFSKVDSILSFEHSMLKVERILDKKDNLPNKTNVNSTGSLESHATVADASENPPAPEEDEFDKYIEVLY